MKLYMKIFIWTAQSACYPSVTDPVPWLERCLHLPTMYGVLRIRTPYGVRSMAEYSAKTRHMLGSRADGRVARLHT